VGATFAIICAATNGHIQIKGFVPEHNDLFLFKLKEIGVTYQINKDILEIFPHRSLKPTKIVTRVFPGFPTDLQAPFSLLLLQAEGKSRIFETIFDSRLKYLLELKKMGGNIEIIDNHNAYIYGPSKLKGCEIRSLDLRAGATLVGAALMAEGESIIYNTELINRGYENFAQKLISLGANIKELS
jgi:UDP-N-acetylglucosamine 1-carboxyvinyltransferase